MEMPRRLEMVEKWTTSETRAETGDQKRPLFADKKEEECILRIERGAIGALLKRLRKPEKTEKEKVGDVEA